MSSRSSLLASPLLAISVVIILLVAGPWPVARAAPDWTGVDKIDVSTTQRLLDVAWNPCLDEALFVGYGGEMGRYSATSIDNIPTNTTVQLSAVAWKPDCSEALVVGGSGTVLLYKDNKITSLKSGVTDLMQDVAWTNDGKAVIVAGSAGLLWYDGTTFTLQANPNKDVELFGIAWNPKANWGVAVGQKETIYRFNSTSIKKVDAPAGVPPFTSFYKASWHRDGGMVTIVGQNGTILDYDGSAFPDLTAGGTGTVVTFLDVDWGSYKDYALLVGDTGTVLCYRAQNDFPCIPSSMQWGLLYGVDWSSNGQEAIIVGNNGVFLLYPGTTTPTPPATINPVAVVFLVIIIILLVIGMFYLYYIDREENKKKRAKFEKRRHKHRERRAKHHR